MRWLRVEPSMEWVYTNDGLAVGFDLGAPPVRTLTRHRRRRAMSEKRLTVIRVGLLHPGAHVERLGKTSPAGRSPCAP